MAQPQDWRDFREAFEAILHRNIGATSIDAEYEPNGGNHGVTVPGVVGTWVVGSGIIEDDTGTFLRLARRAAVAAGCPDGPDSWIYWLEAIRLADVSAMTGDVWRFDRIGPAGDQVSVDTQVVTIKNICYVSAQYCMFLATGAACPPCAAAREQGTDHSSGSASAKPAIGALATKAERRAAVDAYIAEVFDKTGRRITRKDIWKSARYKTRSEFERWQRCAANTTGVAHERFVRVLTERLSLK